MIRLAVIGGGPKSLFALLALNDLLDPTVAGHITVDVYDPLPPGSGSVWRNDQPDALRLNVNAGAVDASSSINSENFAQWVNRVAPEMSRDKYPPRALVGRYLREQFQLLTRFGKLSVAHAPFVVKGVVREGAHWCVCGPFGTRNYDEVLLATGHGLSGAVPREPLAGAVNKQPLIGDYASLSLAEIPPGATVRIRGAALTAYDVALLLTEGRGGFWQHDKGRSPEQPDLHYMASGREPRRITLTSRSGILMDPKSEKNPAEISANLEQYRQDLRKWASQVRENPHDDGGLLGMWAILLQCAQECARLLGSTVTPLSLWRTALTGLSVNAVSGSTNAPTQSGAAAGLRHSLAVNGRDSPITTGWLWARVWSGLYAELVHALDRLPRSTRARRQFLLVARNLERFAFGPPDLTARKLVALFDAGILQLDSSAENRGDEILVDAVTPGPGALWAAGGNPNSDVLAGLLQAGQISVRPGDRGLLTDPDGTCAAHDGSRNESLAAVGRPTEDPTLGHDTLNRDLHGEHRRWAHRVAGRVVNNVVEQPDLEGE
ncbi:Uncharacterized NAD(P)/FAD-binding protein YdhS [Arthrobacter alpinus]|uniref:Uncharacterized NAD(P)/FAD-binding protein YdhS n=1 Tax=Arthrobacter alpinus TaxID=656366 RepID=A0A1H5ID25_9MICC|nr:FAD/NAD(P)-binding domain-containing protein [Arthrobacter alpinus]SEE38113.1 Uncharacterized NAD(P)/FAD-binding protein YdhS [Arthrobacter alpinus]